MFHQKLCMRFDAWVVYYCEAANHQLPIAVAFWIIWIVSVEECSRLMQNLMQVLDANSLLYSFSHFDTTATQYRCSFNGVYHPHWLVQWSCHYSLMCILVHSLSLAARLHRCWANHSCYINNGWTFFPDSPPRPQNTLVYRKLYNFTDVIGCIISTGSRKSPCVCLC